MIPITNLPNYLLQAMIKRKKHYPLYITIIISHFNWDIKLQQKFYDPGSTEGWFKKNYSAHYFVCYYGTFPAIFLSLFVLIIFISSWAVPKFKKLRKFCLLILLTVATDPGILINGEIKNMD